jgi:putative protease
VYGSKATRQKTYIGKVTNYFSNIGVSEILVEAAPISVGDTLMIIGATTGVVELVIPEIRVALKPADTCTQGTYCSIPVADRIRRGDKVYKITVKE